MTTVTPTVRIGDRRSPEEGPAAASSPRRVTTEWLRGERTKQWLRRKAVAAWMNVEIAAAAGVTVVSAGVLGEQEWPEQSTWGAAALKLFALWCLAFLPGWMYVRFIGMRAKALWSEFVLILHRLGWDRPWHLPEPPRTSDFHAGWASGQRPGLSPRDNIYRQKFEAYYGRQVTSGGLRPAAPGNARGGDGANGDYVVSTESLFPVFLATAVLAAGWAAVLWDTSFLSVPFGIWDMLKYGFLGAYAFVTGMLVRRFFQSDLRPSAYTTAVLRIVLVLLVVAVLHQAAGVDSPVATAGEAPAAFLIGFFPLVGLQVLQRVVSRLFRVVVPPLTPEYPLDQLDGLNLWYEARLTEEGVEDMQNLTTMNLVDVILHTRVPPGRLVDWLDQAFLLIHLDRGDRADLGKLRQGRPGPDPAGGAAARVALRRVGIRTATDLLKVFSTEEADGGAGVQRRFALPADLGQPPLPEDQLRVLVRVLAAEPGLTPVWNWQRNGVPRYPTPAPTPESAN
jgi:hypothetical protein